MACFAAPAQIVLTNLILFVIATAAERQTSEPTRNSVFSGNSIYLSAFGSNDDYLDFSMPSYGSSESTSKPKADPPSFGNPFSDFDFKAPKAEESSSAEVEDKAAAEAKKAEDKAAAEAKKAEEKKAAKEAEAAAAAAKKAEKEARRQAELEKQRAAVERAKEASKEETPAPVSTTISNGCTVWIFLTRIFFQGFHTTCT